MKHFVLTLVAVLVGGFLALLVYDRFVVAPRAASTPPPAAQVDLAQARDDARAVADEVEASVQRSVDNAREAMDAQAGEIDRRALVADAVQRATMYRVALTEFHQSNGRWPMDADEAGLPSPEEMRGGAVREVLVGREGVVTVRLGEPFGANDAIVLRPEARPSGQVEWGCEVQGDDALRKALPRCKG